MINSVIASLFLLHLELSYLLLMRQPLFRAPNGNGAPLGQGRTARFTFPPHPLRSFYFTSITVFTKSPYTYTCNQKTDKKTIEKGKKVKERER